MLLGALSEEIQAKAWATLSGFRLGEYLTELSVLAQRRVLRWKMLCECEKLCVGMKL